MRTSPLRKLTDADIDVLVERIGRRVPQREVAAELGIAQSNISRLQRRPDVAARKRQARKRSRDRAPLLAKEREAADRARLIAAMEEDRDSLARGPRAGTE